MKFRRRGNEIVKMRGNFSVDVIDEHGNKGKIVMIYYPIRFRLILDTANELFQVDFSDYNTALDYCEEHGFAVVSKVSNREKLNSTGINKSKIEKFIKWSSSKYNRLSKRQVVDKIIDGFFTGRKDSEVFSCGSYTPSGSLGGWDYEVDYNKRTISRGLKNTEGIFQVCEEIEL